MRMSQRGPQNRPSERREFPALHPKQDRSFEIRLLSMGRLVEQIPSIMAFHSTASDFDLASYRANCNFCQFSLDPWSFYPSVGRCWARNTGRMNWQTKNAQLTPLNVGTNLSSVHRGRVSHLLMILC